MTVKIKLTIIFLSLLFVFNSCCIGAKENYLGNNIYLSEYDNVDRRILYKTESCTVSGVGIVPMTVLEFSYNSNWIIAKSGKKRSQTDFKYWIIKNSYEHNPNSETIKKNTTEFNDYELFKAYLADNNINMKLEKFD